jgi:hypothetical protein
MSKARKWALAIGIAIILAMFVNYGIQTFHKAPDYQDYCRYYSGPVVEPGKFGTANCTTVVADEEFTKNCSDNKGNVDFTRDSNGCAVKPICNTCDNEFRAIENDYNKNVFIILTIIGALSIVAGILIKVDSVAIGFLMGGILNIIIGTMRYWSGLQDVGRFLILGAVLALLVWVGIKKVRD